MISILPTKYLNEHADNKLKHEGNLLRSREEILSKENENLEFLLINRFSWINNLNLNSNLNILELGSGSGILPEYLKFSIKTSDINSYDYLDYKEVNAEETDFKKEEFDVVISSNLIHHLKNPLKHLKEVNRILKKNGKYIIQEVNLSILMKILIILLKHENYDLNVNLNDTKNNEDPWDANMAIPNILFNDKKNYSKFFKITLDQYAECLIFLNSTGVIAKSNFFIKQNKFLNFLIPKLDKILIKFPKIFALQRNIILEKI